MISPDVDVPESHIPRNGHRRAAVALTPTVRHVLEGDATRSLVGPARAYASELQSAGDCDGHTAVASPPAVRHTVLQRAGNSGARADLIERGQFGQYGETHAIKSRHRVVGVERITEI